MLRLWLSLTTSDAAQICIRTSQGTIVNADKVMANAKQTLFACTNLATPLGTYAHAILRDQDVAQLEWDLTISELHALVLDDVGTSSTCVNNEADNICK